MTYQRQHMLTQSHATLPVCSRVKSALIMLAHSLILSVCYDPRQRSSLLNNILDPILIVGVMVS